MNRAVAREWDRDLRGDKEWCRAGQRDGRSCLAICLACFRFVISSFVSLWYSVSSSHLFAESISLKFANSLAFLCYWLEAMIVKVRINPDVRLL